MTSRIRNSHKCFWFPVQPEDTILNIFIPIEVDMDRLETLIGGEHAIPSPFVVRTRAVERNGDFKIGEFR